MPDGQADPIDLGLGKNITMPQGWMVKTGTDRDKPGTSKSSCFVKKVVFLPFF